MDNKEVGDATREIINKAYNGRKKEVCQVLRISEYQLEKILNGKGNTLKMDKILYAIEKLGYTINITEQNNTIDNTQEETQETITKEDNPTANIDTIRNVISIAVQVGMSNLLKLVQPDSDIISLRKASVYLQSLGVKNPSKVIGSWITDGVLSRYGNRNGYGYKVSVSEINRCLLEKYMGKICLTQSV